MYRFGICYIGNRLVWREWLWWRWCGWRVWRIFGGIWFLGGLWGVRLGGVIIGDFYWFDLCIYIGFILRWFVGLVCCLCFIYSRGKIVGRIFCFWGMRCRRISRIGGCVLCYFLELLFGSLCICFLFLDFMYYVFGCVFDICYNFLYFCWKFYNIVEIW